jgi:hypothetical protein
MYLVVAVEALKKNERQDETQFIIITTKIGGKTSLGPSYFVRCVNFFSFPSMPKLAVLAP